MYINHTFSDPSRTILIIIRFTDLQRVTYNKSMTIGREI